MRLSVKIEGSKHGFNKSHFSVKNYLFVTFYHVVLEWSSQTYSAEIATVDASDLNLRLSKFYAEARPKIINSSAEGNSNIYHKNTMKNIWSAINRHLSDIERTVDVVKDREFRIANDTLDDKLNQNVKGLPGQPNTKKL